MVGVGLLGIVCEYVLVIFIGVGVNGKFVFDKVICYVFGDYVCIVEFDFFMYWENVYLIGEMDFCGVWWVVVFESEKDCWLVELMIKWLIGGDIICVWKMW